MNVNFGLRTGWTQGGCIFSALVSIGFFKLFRPSALFSKEEAVIVTTMASAVGSMASTAGCVSSIPALRLLGHNYSVWEMFLWAMSIAYFGLYFSVPLRHQMIHVEKLRFPAGTVTAETINTMLVDSKETVTKAKTLAIVAGVTSFFVFVAFFIPHIQTPPVPAILAHWGWHLYLSPMLLGGGMLTGSRAASILLLGAITGWSILGPIVFINKWTPGDIHKFDGVRGWILWVGVAIMTSDSLVTLLLSSKMIASGLLSACRRLVIFLTGVKIYVAPGDEESEHVSIPFWWWGGGLVVSTILATLVGHHYFAIQYYLIWLSIPLSALLSIIAARCCGETDINPVGSMGKVSQLVFAGLAPKQITTNLLSAGIASAGATQCGDMMHDLKTGDMIGVAPRHQFLTQCIGIAIGTVVCIPIYKLFETAYVLGSDELPVPAAMAWKSVALILADGPSSLPLYAPWGMLGGAIVGVFLAITYKLIHSNFGEDYSCYIPSALALGIGFIIPPKQALTMWLGSMILATWRLVHPDTAKEYAFTVSSGMVAGHGVTGVFLAILKLIGVKPLFSLK